MKFISIFAYMSGEIFKLMALPFRPHPRTNANINTLKPNLSKQSKNPVIIDWVNGADDQIRTGDLILTKDALYLLSYISIFFCRCRLLQ